MIVNNKLKRMCEKEVVSSFAILYQNFLEKLKKTTETLS
jgi:hypothetical protein